MPFEIPMIVIVNAKQVVCSKIIMAAKCSPLGKQFKKMYIKVLNLRSTIDEIHFFFCNGQTNHFIHFWAIYYRLTTAGWFGFRFKINMN